MKLPTIKISVGRMGDPLNVHWGIGLCLFHPEHYQFSSAQSAGLCAVFNRNSLVSSKNAVAIVTAGGSRASLRMLRVHA